MDKLKTHQERELLVKDATIKNLEDRLYKHKIEIKQAISIMKIPRLMNQVEKMLNYDRIEITKDIPN